MVTMALALAVIDRAEYGGTAAVAPGRMPGDVIPIPDAESLSFAAWYQSKLIWMRGERCVAWW